MNKKDVGNCDARNKFIRESRRLIDLQGKEHLSLGRLLTNIRTKDMSTEPSQHDLWAETLDAFNEVENQHALVRNLEKLAELEFLEYSRPGGTSNV